MVDNDRPQTSDGIELTQFPLEHEDVSDYINELRSGRSAEDVLDNYIINIGNIDVRSALERLTIAHMASSVVTASPIADDGVGLPPAQHNYLIGLLVTHGSADGTMDAPYSTLCGPVMNICLKSIFGIDKELSPQSPKEEKLKSEVQFSLRQQVFTVGNFLMTEQPLEAARRAYKPHNKYLSRELGFTIEEAIDSVYHMMDIFAERRNKVAELDGFDLDLLISPGNTMDSLAAQYGTTGSVELGPEGFDFQRDTRAIEHVYSEVKESRDLLSTPIDILENDLPENVAEESYQSIIDRLTTEVGEVKSNPDFQWPYQFNPIFKTPIIEFSNRYFTPNGNILQTALMESFYYDLISLEDYGDPTGDTGGEFGRIYGDYLEDWAYDCLINTYTEDSVYANPILLEKGYPEACDVLVEGVDTLFVVECKIGKIPLQLRNSSFQEIQDVIQSKIGKGYSEQSLPLIKKLREGRLSTLGYNGEYLEVDEYENYRPIIIVSEPYDAVATHLIDVVIEANDVSPYVLDIFDLQILTEYFNTPVGFEEFVNERMQLFNRRNIVSPDELDYLGLYIQNEDSFPEIPEDQWMWVDDMTHVVGPEIDYKFGY